ncbi:uncharacterized protein [Haliaeetus albicilla]|uniref:uncharacterized protein isoform X1 n=1 Tax=Haliaeetus albicilla TaxID=8969 RepID=UPI0037E76432
MGADGSAAIELSPGPRLGSSAVPQHSAPNVSCPLQQAASLGKGFPLLPPRRSAGRSAVAEERGAQLEAGGPEPSAPPPLQGTWGCWRQALRSSAKQRLGRCRCVRVCMLNAFLAPRNCTMLKILTKKLRNQSLNEIQPFQLKISYPPSDEDSDDSEGENQELAQIDRERRRNCTLTPLATNQLQNQENQCCKVRALFHASLDRHSSEEELERINREFAAEKRKWSQVSRLACCSDSNNTSSSDEEVKNLCAMSFQPVAEQADGLHASPSPVLFSASPPKRLQPLVRSPASRPLIFTSVGAGLEQVMPCKRHRQGYGDKVSRPSLDLEKMQQKMLLKKNCGVQTRVIKIHSINGGRPPPHFVYDPSTFAFRSLSTLKPLSPIAPVEEPSCAY